MPIRPAVSFAVALAVASIASAAVRVEKTGDGGYRLLVDGKPFFIEGVGGSGPKPLLKEIGGNAFRTWGVDDNLGKQLDEAQRLGLKVAVGIWLEHERHGFSYSDPAFVQKQFEKAKAAIEKYKGHPAVLLWGIGNEMEGYKSGDDPRIWKAVNDIAAMAKQVDPDHPTMTVVAEIGGNKLQALRELAPAVDIVGINSYAGAASLGTRYGAGNVGKPYVVTEFGPPGTWEVGKTEWDVAREPTSTEKAAAYKKSWDEGIAAQRDKLCLGGFAFTWGNKQETTGTWFGMLLSDGSKVGAVDAMQEAWTGKPPADRVPTIRPLELASDKPAKGSTIDVALDAADPEGKPLSATWTLSEEVERLSEGGDFEAAPADVAKAILSGDARGARVQMPERPGRYRLFVVVKDPAGNAATANAPLLVVGPTEPGKERLAQRAKLPLVLYGDDQPTTPFIASGWMGKTEAIALDPKSTTNPKSGATCMKCEFNSADNFGGVVWQSPANDWGDQPGGLDLSGAKRLSFWARGESGGEKVQFKFGIIEKAKPFHDTASGATTVTLEKGWKRFTIDLAGKDLRRVKTGFVWVVGDVGKPQTFYLDDIKYE